MKKQYCNLEKMESLIQPNNKNSDENLFFTEYFEELHSIETRYYHLIFLRIQNKSLIYNILGCK